jgi:hypothetical protein
MSSESRNPHTRPGTRYAPAALAGVNFFVYGEGLPLMVSACILVLLAVLMESVASCKLRGFPGIGAGAAGCCAVALEETAAEDNNAPVKA